MASELTDITDDNFENEIIKSSGLSIVDFWAQWCGPCRMLTPILEEVSKTIVESGQENKVRICKMNIDDNPITPSKYGVMSIPMIIMFKNGEVIDQKLGVRQKQTILNWIEQNS